jgi:isopenicillin-N epimerase
MASRADFLLRDDVIFLNHGSFGACPRPVFEAFQRWQLESERQPVAFYQRRYDALLEGVRALLADYVNADSDEIILMPNATVALNMVAQRVALRPGDEVLTTDHEYGAMIYLWRWACQRAGASLVQAPLPYPLPDEQALYESVIARATPRTRVLFVSHITSPTAIRLPLERLLAWAGERGILTVVDGAHTVGQVPLNLRVLGADIYTSNCHKWLCAPKGAAFLYVRRDAQPQFDPLIISWGYTPGSSFAAQNQWQGTRDVAAYLAIPDAIAFQQAHDWQQVRQRCHALARQFREGMAAITGLAPLTPDGPEWYGQMSAAPLPPTADPAALKQRLLDDYGVEMPITTRGDQCYARASFQAYNTPQELATALLAFRGLLSA